jgi:eukaryotic-like serine/threonine-protein kinase
MALDMADSTKVAASGEAVTELHSGPVGDIADPDAEIPVFPADQRYEAGTSLGEGGMGEVRLCRDRVIGREVALKAILGSHAARGELRARFVREARVQGQLEHPAIVPVYDFGVDGAGQPFFTMKRVRGSTMEDVIDALRRGDQAAARYYTLHKLLGAFVQVCLAIDFAHERGVVHRDLKPANVMLGGHGEVYVLDWGVAKVRSASSPLDTKPSAPSIRIDGGGASLDEPREVITGDKYAPTAAGAILGTPAYMAPEQLAGGEVDARTDVYALGGILFELLTLEPLHGSGTVASMMKRAIQGADARASVRAPDREIPPELEIACVRACARLPDDRHASARELADAVEAYLNGDRDLEQRRVLARVHLDRARDAAARARVPGAPASERTEALREVGRAVALDPTSDAAMQMLVTMLTQPPKELPPEVVANVEAARADAQRRMLPRVSLIYAISWLVFLPFQLYFGVLDLKLVLMPIIAWVLAATGVFLIYRNFATAHGLLRYQVMWTALALALSSAVFGPLLILPTLVVMSTMGTILISHRNRRVLLVVVNGLALLVPTALGWLGYLPVTHFVDGDRTLRIGFAAFAITRDNIFWILAASHVGLFAVGAKFAAQYRDALTAAELKSEVQSWQLRQLVPDEAGRALAERPKA